jgi:hypothetical protein
MYLIWTAGGGSHMVPRAQYVEYLRHCAALWRALGQIAEADRVLRKARQIVRRTDDISRAEARR